MRKSNQMKWSKSSKKKIKLRNKREWTSEMNTTESTICACVCVYFQWRNWFFFLVFNTIQTHTMILFHTFSVLQLYLHLFFFVVSVLYFYLHFLLLFSLHRFFLIIFILFILNVISSFFVCVCVDRSSITKK